VGVAVTRNNTEARAGSMIQSVGRITDGSTAGEAVGLPAADAVVLRQPLASLMVLLSALPNQCR